MPCLMVLAALVRMGPAQINCTGDHPPLNLTLRGAGTADQAIWGSVATSYELLQAGCTWKGSSYLSKSSLRAQVIT